jgi:hypothetical protein
MIVCIQPVEQWTGATDRSKATYLELPEGIDPDEEYSSFYFSEKPLLLGENHLLLINHFIKLGAKVVNPIKTYFV